MKHKQGHDLNIVGDFLKYTVMLMVPLSLFGAIYGLIYQFSFTALLLNPLAYSIGISLIIIVITYDINDILDLFGLAQKHQLKDGIRYSKEVQEISMLMSREKYGPALTKVNALLLAAPKFVDAHIMRGEILLQGFHKKRDARKCFETVLQLSNNDDEQYKLAKALKASTYDSQ